MTTRLEHDLHEMFASRARSVPLTIDPYGRTARAIWRSRARRRVRRWAASVVVFAVAALVASPVATGKGVFSQIAAAIDPRPRAAERLLNWPVRGDLAHDEGVVRHARDLLGRTFSDEYGADDVQLLFVGRVGEFQVAVGAADVEIDRDRRTNVHLVELTGDPVYWNGTFPSFAARQPAAVTVPVTDDVGDSTPGRGWLLVLGAPDLDRLELSERPQFTVDGRAVREFHELDSADHAVAVELPAGEPVFPRVRAHRDGSIVYDEITGPPWLLSTDESGSLDVASAMTLGDGLPTARGMANALAELSQRGADLHGATADVVWQSSPGEGATFPEGGAAVLAVRLADGAAFQLVVSWPDDLFDTNTGATLARLVPAALVDQLPIAWRAAGQDSQHCELLVAVPNRAPAGVTATFVSTDGEVRGTASAGGLVRLDGCDQTLQGGLLTVMDAATHSELLRWEIQSDAFYETRPDWAYEGIDQRPATAD